MFCDGKASRESRKASENLKGILGRNRSKISTTQESIAVVLLYRIFYNNKLWKYHLIKQEKSLIGDTCWAVSVNYVIFRLWENKLQAQTNVKNAFYTGSGK